MIDGPLSIANVLLTEKWETLNNLVFNNSSDVAKFEKQSLGGTEIRQNLSGEKN